MNTIAEKITNQICIVNEIYRIKNLFRTPQKKDGAAVGSKMPINSINDLNEC